MHLSTGVVSRKRVAVAMIASLLLVGCAGIPSLNGEPIHCERKPAARGNSPTLIGFAGWKVSADDSRHWAHTLAGAGFAHDPPARVCAARGPMDASYQLKDIDTGALASALIAQPPSGKIVVVAHSSGSFVAHHFFRQLRDAGGAHLLARMHYVNLDGAVGEGEREIDAEMIAAQASVRAVYALNPLTNSESANASSMRRLHALAPEKVRLIALPVPEAGCNPGAKWCLHNALINRKPYNPASFDLKRDYGEINAAHPVEASYLRAEK